MLSKSVAAGSLFAVFALVLILALFVQHDLGSSWHATASALTMMTSATLNERPTDPPALQLDIKANLSTSPLNGLKLNPNACFRTPSTFSLLFAGHTYGGQPGGSELYPSRNLMTCLGEIIEQTHPCALVLLGDTIRWAYDPKAVMLYDWFVNMVPVPIFVSPGNHDSMVFGPKRYFGVPFFYEVVVSDLTKVIICNGDRTIVEQQPDKTIIQDHQMGLIGDKQLAFLKMQLEATTQEMIVIAFHRCVWSEYFPIVWQRVNSRGYYRAGEWAKVESLLQAARKRGKRVLVTGGDIGMYWTLSIFYGVHDGIEYMAVGMADWDMDALVALDVDEESKEFKFRVFSGAPQLRGAKMRPIQHYNETLWEKFFAKVDSRKAAKLKFDNNAKARYFHLGEEP